MKTTILASLLLLAMGCAQDSSNSPAPSKIRRGEKMKPVDAQALLINTPKWCYSNTEQDAFFAKQSFHPNGKASYYPCRRADNHCDAPIAMTWAIAEDLLTMNLPKRFQLVATMRLLDGNIQLWEDENTLKTTLVSCSQ